MAAESLLYFGATCGQNGYITFAISGLHGVGRSGYITPAISGAHVSKWLHGPYLFAMPGARGNHNGPITFTFSRAPEQTGIKVDT